MIEKYIYEFNGLQITINTFSKNYLINHYGTVKIRIIRAIK